MDGDLLVRILLVGAVGGGAAAAAFVARQGMARRRHTFDPVGLEPGFALFSSSTCATCSRARDTLERLGVEFVEHTYEHDRDLLVANGIDRVPTLVHVSEDGSAWAAYGVPSDAMVRRSVGP